MVSLAYSLWKAWASNKIGWFHGEMDVKHQAFLSWGCLWIYSQQHPILGRTLSHWVAVAVAGCPTGVVPQLGESQKIDGNFPAEIIVGQIMSNPNS